METSIEFFPDSDGFIRRECPHCEQTFKWHVGPTNEQPDDAVEADVYWCPRCGLSAAKDQWWTQDQLEIQREYMLAVAQDMVADALKGTFGKAAQWSGPRAAIPDPLVELDDMMIVAPPCHPWEPVKVPQEAGFGLYCLICGESYSV